LAASFARIAHLFARAESRARAADYIQGLLSGIGRKNSWRVAAYAGHASPDGIQWLLTRAPWNADALRDITRDYVVEKIGSSSAVAVFDDIAFPKRGEKSVGVARQRTSAGRLTENCQVGVFMTYASPEGTALIDRDLYLPRPEWAEDTGRRSDAGVPAGVRYLSRSELATRMLARALRADVPIGSVMAGQSCAGPPLRDFCAARGLALIEEISAHQFIAGSRLDRPIEAQTLVKQIPQAAFEHRDPGSSASESTATLWLGPHNSAGYHTSLIVRRHGPHNAFQYFLSHMPNRMMLDDLVSVTDTLAKARQYATRSRQEAGLDQYEVRKWDPWYRHITLCMFALAYLAANHAERIWITQFGATAPAERMPVRLSCHTQRIMPNSSAAQTIGPSAPGQSHHTDAPGLPRSAGRGRRDGGRRVPPPSPSAHHAAGRPSAAPTCSYVCHASPALAAARPAPASATAPVLHDSFS
jgi:SRSO17 transposase